MARLRSLAACFQVAERHGLEPWWGAGELLFTCPICREAGLKATACIEQDAFGISPRCRGCVKWDDDPWGPLHWLQSRADADARAEYDHVNSQFAIPLAVFDLLWALEKQRRRDGDA